MKTLLILLLALALALPAVPALAGSCGSCSTCASGDAKAAPDKKAGKDKGKADSAAVVNVTPVQVHELIKSGEPVVVLDARSGKYDDGRRLPGARSLNAGSPPEEIAKLLPDKNAKIVAYCAHEKCPAGPDLAKHLVKLGYKNVHELPVGIDGWEKAGFPVEKAK